MKELYSIGEVAKIMDVSVQTLRYYGSIDLLKPIFINPATGYRYFSVNQFHLLDRIKYLQKLGLSLEEIREVLVNNDINKLTVALDTKEKEYIQKIQDLKDTLHRVEWYKNYFGYSPESGGGEQAYTRYYDKRHIVAAKVEKNEPKEDYHIRLNVLRYSDPLKDLKYMRQFYLVLEYDSFLKGQIDPLYLGMSVFKPPFTDNPNIIEIPAGNYFCFNAQILTDNWDPSIAEEFFKCYNDKPTYVFASEYENDLHEYSQCYYQVQILINEVNPD
ncbi:MerR family transcriptional regulator [Fusibacter ferrireducens]|uniref:MerR family transcriptional regulator n=1 Tax=Fusibacter ferrireducens TaxID=2785058 RepID=A0ABR9ZX46_9FIRM|nr:helix-turn-helix domain-containing protein [Fusibacter ferrireducens]MBF4695027.1 MerR family transcriptional regulator [Fusibacter ferrireducens]